MIKRVLAMALVASAGTAQAQDAVYWSAPVAAAPGRTAYFPMGTPLRLVTHFELSSRTSRPGDRFPLSVVDPLVYQGQVVVPAGAVAMGEVVRADGTAMFGQRGRMAVRLLYVQTPAGPIALTGRVDSAGRGQEALSIGGALFVSWPMMFIRGTSARMAENSAITGYLAEDLRFAAAPRALAAIDAGAQPPAAFDPAAFAGVRAR